MAIHHVVFLKFRKGAPKAAVERFITELNRLPDYNPEVRHWIAGYSSEPRFHNGDFDFGLACDLDDWAAMDRYMWNEGHLRMGEFIGDLFEHVLSFDFETECVVPQGSGQAAAPKAAPPLPRGQAWVPNLSGRHLEEATELLRAAGLALGKIARQPNPFWAAGRVAAQQPAEGVVPRGTLVDLVVASDFRVKPEPLPPA